MSIRNARVALLACALSMALSACDDGPAPARPAVAAPSAQSASDAATGKTAPEPAPAADEDVLPGRFAPDTTQATLEARFGKGNVVVGTLPGAEGETHRGITLFPGDPAREALVYFQDEQALRGLSLVSVMRSESRWRTDGGVRIGMPLAELVALNGKPVVFSGFEWDYGGYVTSWNDGALAPKDGDPVRRGVRLGLASDAQAAPAARYPSGDGEFRSDDPRYPDLGTLARVEAILVSFPGEDDL